MKKKLHHQIEEETHQFAINNKTIIKNAGKHCPKHWKCQIGGTNVKQEYNKQSFVENN